MVRKKILPDRVFHTLWNEAQSADERGAFLGRFTSPLSPDRIQFLDKYGISIDESRILLGNIYDMSRLTVRDILDSECVGKAEVSHTFCIPIRTVEDWYAGVNVCPSYVRLAILRHYFLFTLGQNVILESELKREQRRPRRYRPRNTECRDEKGERRRWSKYSDDNERNADYLSRSPIQSRGDVESSMAVARLLADTDTIARYLREKREKNSDR